ncbi:unnamed protein product [Ophioblennius macclurei]
MERAFPHAVVFELFNPSEEQKKKIQNYFQIRRKSGGGECGSVERVHGNVYSIAFKDKTDQQKVLQKVRHVVDGLGGSLVLTVHDGSSPTSIPSSDPSASREVNSTASLKEQSPTPGPTSSPPHQEEHVVHLDRYVVRYLRESPNAQKELQEKLDSMACQVLSVKEEDIVVRHVVQPGTAEVRNWREGVGKVFDCYTCHYEVDSRKVKALLQSCGSHQSSGGVKVYSEIGVVVVVGERSQVTAELKDVEDSLVKLKVLGAGEKRTTTVRLGEGKLHLLCENIKCKLKEKVPDVEVTQGDAGQLVLSGSVEDIVIAGTLISDMEDLVLKRTVTDKSPHFLAFLRKAYGAPGVFANVLWGSDEVQIEIGDTELHLFSLSGNKLDESVKRINNMFKDVKFDVPNCSAVPFELLEQIKSKSNVMNQGKCRVDIVVGLDSTLWLLGHTKEVDELCQTVKLFILDQSSTQGTVSLPFPEIVPVLSHLLQLHDFDYSGVTLYPLKTASGPIVALEGPQGKVTDVKNRLNPFLGSLVQERITIDLPGGARFFKSPSGKDSMVSIARSQKSLIQLEEQPQTASRQCLKSGKYILQHGIEVLVCQGDMTKQHADALVNPANESLEHGGGLAAALSTAGGPQVQIESRNKVRQSGKISVGTAVMTTSGNLKCKQLIHVVGPTNGQVGGQERPLLEKTVRSALDLAETMHFKSIAIPSISSGLFGVPLAVCAEAIVAAVKTFGSQGGRSLNKIILIDISADVVGALKDACDRLLKDGSGKAAGGAAQDTARRASTGLPRRKIHIELIHGTIETQQVDALVSPLAGLNLTSTRVGIALSNVAGPQLKAAFDKVAVAGLKPGDILVVDNLTALKSKIVIFIWLSAWDNTDLPTQVLRQGIRETLYSCEDRDCTSVAFSLLGTGQILKFPPGVAAKVLLEEIRAFEHQRSSQTQFTVRVVIHPKNKESYKEFKSALDASQPGGATGGAGPVAASFYHCTSATSDKVACKLGNVALQMVQGNITNAGADVIVNTTDFVNTNAGVCKAILTAAGPSVQKDLAKVGLPLDLMCSTGPGLLGCKEIIHATFKNDKETIRKKCKKIVKQCEQKGHQSVAFPAINTGQGGVDAAKVCKAMLDGMAAAIRDLNPQSLSLIRIVIMQPTIFKAFKTELESRFGQDAPCYTSLKENAKQRLSMCQDQQPASSLPSAPQAQRVLSSKPPRAVMSVISCGSDVIHIIRKELEDALQKHLIERQVDVKYFTRLEEMDVEALQTKVQMYGVSLEHRKYDSPGAGPYVSIGPASSEEIYVLKGLKEDVLSVSELLNKSIHTVLSKDLQDKEEAMMALIVQWSIKDTKGAWQELSLQNNNKLEKAHMRKQAVVDIMAPTGTMVSVDLRKQEATDSQTGNKYQMKRSQSETALELPPHWEPMNDEMFKKVELQQQSEEYKTVAQGFKKTANYTIHKIERVQNVFLWHAFSVCRQRILKKNGEVNLGEKLLYHGTSAESCNCIEKDRFDRNYAGAHAALYGKGVYFAVNANYSARGYSPADKLGLKRLYAARVLTGRYTAGKGTLVAPPPRGTDPTDCFDSVVDNATLPSMFVVFHDDQAYPEYLITFK